MSSKDVQAGPRQCLNCGQQVEANFCGHCGQKKWVARLSVHELWHEMVHAFLHADKSIFRFAWLSLTKPGIVARDFLAGRRKMYFNPLQFFLLATALNVFLMSQTGLMELMMSNAYGAGGAVAVQPNVSAEQQQMQSQMQKAMVGTAMPALIKYMAIFNLLFLPFFAIVFGWFYKKAKLFFAERYFVCLMVYNQYTVLSIALIPLTFLASSVVSPVYLTASGLLLIPCFAITLRQLFQDSWFSSIAKGTLISILGFVFFFLVFGLFAMIFGVIWAILHAKK